MLRGSAISPGVAVARAYRMDEVLARHDPTILDAAALSAEVTRFEQACAAVSDELDATIEQVSSTVGKSEADIFRAHRMLLRDPSFIGKVTSRMLTQKMDARTALAETFDEYSKLFGQIPDEYLRERLADLRDVVNRIHTHLVMDNAPECLAECEPVVLVAQEILPSQTVMFDRLKVVGILTETGAVSGHAAILARSLGIPAVSGISSLLSQVRTGELVALDGREGLAIINPGHEVETAYRKLEREFFDLRDRLVENRLQEAI